MSISKKLDEYFKNNSKEQVLKDWEATKIYDSVNAPTVEQFLLHNVGKPKGGLLKTYKEWKQTARIEFGNLTDHELVEKYLESF